MAEAYQDATVYIQIVMKVLKNVVNIIIVHPKSQI